MTSDLLTIHLWGALTAPCQWCLHGSGAGNTIRELFRILSETWPGMEPHIRRGVAVSINGQIFRDQWDTSLPQDAEIYLLPRVPVG